MNASSYLFNVIQGMIEANGGRIKLADMLEAEMLKMPLYHFKPKKAKKATPHNRWLQSEIEFLKNNRHQTLASISRVMNRSVRSVQNMSSKLVRTGVIKSTHNKHHS